MGVVCSLHALARSRNMIRPSVVSHKLLCPPRLLLALLGYFGDCDNVSLADRLVIAYKDFKVFCRTNRVFSSQPLFTVKSAAKLY